MSTKLVFLLTKLLSSSTNIAILVFLISMMQPQHGFSSVEEEEETEKKNNDNKNNPPGFKSIKKFDNNGNFITKWGIEGYGDDGQFWLPHDIAIDSSDNVYVVDSGNVHEKKEICAL